MSELKLCPFCGGNAKLHQHGNEHTKKRGMIIQCETPGCFAEQRVFVIKNGLEWAKEKVVENWNTRPQADIERLKEIVNALAPGEQNSVHAREGYESAIIDVLAAIDEVMGQQSTTPR